MSAQDNSDWPQMPWVLLLLGSSALLGVSWALVPSPTGIGTHTQLGLPPCGFLTLTGHPCPGCGLTTAFCALARGDVAAAWTANPAALPLFALLVAALVLSVVALFKRLEFTPTLVRANVGTWLLLGAAIVVATWAIRHGAPASTRLYALLSQ